MFLLQLWWCTHQSTHSSSVIKDCYVALHCLLTDSVHVHIIHIIKTSWVGLRSRFGERSVEKVVVSLQYLIYQASTDRGSGRVKILFAPHVVHVEAAAAVHPWITKISGKKESDTCKK